jgi:hypothetical protein
MVMGSSQLRHVLPAPRRRMKVPQSSHRCSPTSPGFALADVQYGLDWLADQQPGAKISWANDTTTKTVDVTPWTGALWPGMPDVFYDGLDAALMHDGNGRIYLFKGSDYIRFSSVAAGVDPGYPKKIADGWHGLPAEFQERIDAAVWRLSDGRIYFFRGSQYVRIDGTTFVVDPGYPVLTSGNWKGMPDAFNAKIDAALWRKSDGKMYFFRKRDFLRFTDIAAGVDDGYPKPMRLSQNAAEALWRDAAMSQLGQPTGMGGVEAYAASLRDEYGTDTAYLAFFTRWPVTWFAYAGFPRVVMHLNNDGWGFDNIDSVFAHETGHIFGAPDEYSSACSCSSMRGRFFSAANSNCDGATTTGSARRRHRTSDGGRSPNASTPPSGGSPTALRTCSAVVGTSATPTSTRGSTRAIPSPSPANCKNLPTE